MGICGNVVDIEWTTEGALVTIRRSKTDQEGLGRKVAIPHGEIACLVAALKAWLEAASITEGAVFRRIFNKLAQRITDRRLAGRNVASVVKAGAAKLGFDPSTFGGHSLRSGLVTTAVKRGVKGCDQTGHKSLEMLRVYLKIRAQSRRHARTDTPYLGACAAVGRFGSRYRGLGTGARPFREGQNRRQLARVGGARLRGDGIGGPDPTRRVSRRRRKIRFA
jgi:hypothetical protein